MSEGKYEHIRRCAGEIQAYTFSNKYFTTDTLSSKYKIEEMICAAIEQDRREREEKLEELIKLIKKMNLAMSAKSSPVDVACEAEEGLHDIWKFLKKGGGR